MWTSHRHGWLKWVFAVAAIVAAGMARVVFWPELFRDATFLPFFGAVLFAAWYGGLGPGLLALLTGAAWIAWSVFPPLENFAVADPRSQISMALYLAFGIAICVACHTLHLGRRRERTTQVILREREVRRVQLEMDASRLAADAERKDRFLATLAHELRNPLAPVRYAVELARRRPDRVDVALATIDRQVDHLHRLVEDLVDVGRVARGTLELRTREIRAADVAAASVEAATPLIEQGRHRFESIAPDPVLTLHGDLVRVAQVVINLLNNAAKFTPPGGEIRLRIEADDRTVAFVVTDSGPGVDPADVERLMQPFEQGAPPPNHVVAGLGIGLALARQIVDLHGGSLTLEPAPDGHGTRATARFPRATDAVPSHVAALPRTSAGTLRALVADDNADAVTSLATLLEYEGHAVAVAQDGDAACDAAARHRPDVAFIDLGMPKRDGLDVCRWIRQQPWGRDVRLIAVTGWGQPADFERTREAGFDLHLVKPVAPDAILKALNDIGNDGTRASHCSATH